MSQKQVTTATGWPQTKQSKVLRCRYSWPRCWIFGQNQTCPIIIRSTTVWHSDSACHLSFRWTLQETTNPTFTEFTVRHVSPPTMTAATVGDTGARSWGETAMLRVRCGRDTGRSSIRDSGWTRTTIERVTMTLGRSRCPHPPRCTTICSKPKMEKAFSTRRIGPRGNRCYIAKFQIRGLSIIFGQGERAGLTLTKTKIRKGWEQTL